MEVIHTHKRLKRVLILIIQCKMCKFEGKPPFQATWVKNKNWNLAMYPVSVIGFWMKGWKKETQSTIYTLDTWTSVYVIWRSLYWLKFAWLVIFDSEQLPHTRSVSCAYNGSCKNVFLANLCCKNVHGISETLLLGYKFYFLLVP